VTVVAGPPIDLSEWEGAEPTATSLHAITDEVMSALRGLLATVRGESPPDFADPSEPHDRAGGESA
jgi:hypothetical protein